MRRHGAAIWIGQRYFALAAFLEFRQQRTIMTTLLVQRLDLFSEMLDARTLRSGFLDIAFVKALQIFLQTFIHRLDEFLQRIARKILVFVIDRLDARAIHGQQLAPEKLEVFAQQGELAKHDFEGGPIFTPEIGDGFEVGFQGSQQPNDLDVAREWKKRGGYAVSFRRPSLKCPSKTATLAWSTRCAPRGDQRIWRRLLKRRLTKALAVDSARELETGSDFDIARRNSASLPG